MTQEELALVKEALLNASNLLDLREMKEWWATNEKALRLVTLEMLRNKRKKS